MKKILGIALGAGILLTACGSNGSPAADQKEVKFGEMMNKGEQISYKVKNYDGEQAPTKNSEIKYIIKTNKGKVTAYNVQDDIELKDIKDKSDKEIIDLAKKQDKKYMSQTKKGSIDKLEVNIKTLKGYIKNGDGNSKDSYQEDLAKEEKMLKELKNYKYDEPKERELKIKAVEDETGNNTAMEKFYAVPHDFDISTYKSKSDVAYDDKSHTYLSYDRGEGTMKIYDQNYAFLSDSDNEGDDEKDFLITPVSDKTEFSKLDEPDSKYVKAVDEEE